MFQLGRWWTIFTASWLHGDILHIAFNLFWLSQLIPVVQRLYGLGRLIIIYIVSGVVSSILTSLASQYLPDIPILGGASFSIGASGAVFGLFGALVAYGQITKDSYIRQRYATYAIIFLILGMMMPDVDNWGHLGGFLGGYAISLIPSCNPLKPEKIQHILISLSLLCVTLLSFIVSIVHGLYLVFVLHL